MMCKDTIALMELLKKLKEKSEQANKYNNVKEHGDNE